MGDHLLLYELRVQLQVFRDIPFPADVLDAIPVGGGVLIAEDRAYPARLEGVIISYRSLGEVDLDSLIGVLIGGFQGRPDDRGQLTKELSSGEGASRVEV